MTLRRAGTGAVAAVLALLAAAYLALTFIANSEEDDPWQ